MCYNCLHFGANAYSTQLNSMIIMSRALIGMSHKLAACNYTGSL